MLLEDIDVVGEVIAKLILETTEPLRARIEKLEARPTGAGCEWKGVYVDGQAYAAGSLTTRNGGLWLALRDTTQTPGLDPVSWRLVVKEGRGHDR